MDEMSLSQLKKEIAELEQLLSAKKRLLEEAQNNEPSLDMKTASASEDLPQASPSGVNQNSTKEEKIALFRSLFKGREDVYAKRYESKKTGKSGYSPVFLLMKTITRILINGLS